MSNNPDKDDEMDASEMLDASFAEGGLQIDDDIFLPPAPKRFREEDNIKGPRLIISKIFNKNFKSYANEVIIGPFHQCFSAIVGPNGSGKSNIIDALLFVFGYRASKIRSKKVSQLIHNSSEYPNATSCTVGIYFQKVIDKDEGFEVVPDTEFVISKTAFKDNSSIYELNGKKVHFKEIAKLLRSEGVDLDYNRFLILQGEVEQIALMKPKAQNENDPGMLEFLDDIIGTSRFKTPLEKMVEKVDLLNEKVSERMNRLKIVENERNSLKEPMEEAIGFLKLENTIIGLQHKLYHCKKFAGMAKLKDDEAILEEIRDDCAKLKEKIKAIEAEKEAKNTELNNKCMKWNQIQAKVDELTEKFEVIRKQDETLHAELVETNKRRKQNKAAIVTEEENLKKLENLPKKCEDDIVECEGLIKKNQEHLGKEEDKLKTLMKSLQEKTEPLLKKRSELEKKLIEHRKNINEAKGEYDLKESKLKLYTSEEKIEREKLEKIQQALKEAGEMVEDRKTQLFTLDKKIPETEKCLQKAQKELEEVKSEEKEANNQMRNLRTQIEEKRSAMNASRSRNRVIDALLQAKKQGKFPGILGRLGDLGAIDAKYDVAISTACGPLDNVVVDTVETAEACIKFLRDNNIGRTTFIALEKMQRFIPQCEKKINTPENIPRLFDLVKVQDKAILPAFYYGLNDTLVANDLDQATRIAYGAKRFRVVTLKGELIEIAGTMSGGGKTVLRGRMGQKVVNSDVSPADIEKLQKKFDSLYENTFAYKDREQPLEQQIANLSAELNEMNRNREKFKIEVRSLNEQLPALKKQLKTQETKAAATKSNPAEVKKLIKAVEDAKQELEEVKEQSKSIEEKVAKINADIDELSGNRVKEQQKKIKVHVDAIDKAKSEICRLEVVLKTNDRNISKVIKKTENLKADVIKFENRLKSIEEEKKQFEIVGKEILENLTELTTKLEERDEAVGSLKTELNALQDKEKELKALKIDIDQKLSDSKKSVADLKLKVSDYTNKIKGLALRKISGEPLEMLVDLTEEEVNELDGKTVAANLAAAKERLPETIPNLQIIEDYEQKDAMYLQRSAEVNEVTENRNKLRKQYDMLKRQRHEEFFAGFNVITTKLKEMYQMITLGGAAELELVDSLDPYAEGIAFSVRPPKKSWKSISNLSGGEKTLSSLALVFALHHYKPTPLYFMDEIDAALDFKNVSIVGTYIKERTKNAQFIVISLRSEMFELANKLVGIYKTCNATKTACLDIEKFFKQNPDIEKKEKLRKERLMKSSLTSSQTKKKTSSQGSIFTSQLSNQSFDQSQSQSEERLQRLDKSPVKSPNRVSNPSNKSLSQSPKSSSKSSSKSIETTKTSATRDLRKRKSSEDLSEVSQQRRSTRRRLNLSEVGEDVGASSSASESSVRSRLRKKSSNQHKS